LYKIFIFFRQSQSCRKYLTASLRELFSFILNNNFSELASKINETWNEETVQAAVTLTATWPLAYQGFALNKLELDSFTLSEVGFYKKHCINI